MFTPALFTVSKIRKQLKYPTTDKWLKRVFYMYVYIYNIYTMEY